MKPYNIINPIARALALSRRRTQVIPNKKKKDKSRKNKTQSINNGRFKQIMGIFKI